MDCGDRTKHAKCAALYISPHAPCRSSPPLSSGEHVHMAVPVLRDTGGWEVVAVAWLDVMMNSEMN